MLDYVIVARLNIKAGISDKAFVLGDEVRYSLPITVTENRPTLPPDLLTRMHRSA